MIKIIKNTKKPKISYVVSINLRDIIVVVREKNSIGEWVDKLKVKFKIVDEYPQKAYPTTNGGLLNQKIKKIEVNDETVYLYTVEDYSLEDMLDRINSKFKADKLIEDYVLSTLKNAKTIEFPDDEDEDSTEAESDFIDMS